MSVYLINITLTLLLGVYLIYIDPSREKKKWFCILASVNWTLISGLRHWSIGADTLNYVTNFERVGRTSWEDVWMTLYRAYIQGYAPNTSSEAALYKDAGYLLFQKIVHVFTDEPQVFLLIVAALFFAAMGRFIYKHSEDPCFSYVLFSTLFYSFYAITGIRQTLATALVVLVGYDFIKQRKLWKFFLVSLLAFLLHKSAVVFIPFYFLAYVKIDWKFLSAITAFTAAVFAIGSEAIFWFASLVGYDRDEAHELPTYTYTFLILLVALVVLLCYKITNKSSIETSMKVSGSLVAAVLTLFTLLDQSMMRVQLYYALVLLLSLPDAFMSFKAKNRMWITALCVAVLVVMFIRNNPQYQFFWQ